MKMSFAVTALWGAVLFGSIALAQSQLPRMTSVEPTDVKVGDAITITGENLQKANVAEIYLTDGKTDLKLTVSQQSGTEVKTKVPAGCKPGRWALMILTAGKEPKLIEQPVKVNVE